jgi:hypothetical protein
MIRVQYSFFKFHYYQATKLQTCSRTPGAQFRAYSKFENEVTNWVTRTRFENEMTYWVTTCAKRVSKYSMVSCEARRSFPLTSLLRMQRRMFEPTWSMAWLTICFLSYAISGSLRNLIGNHWFESPLYIWITILVLIKGPSMLRSHPMRSSDRRHIPIPITLVLTASTSHSDNPRPDSLHFLLRLHHLSHPTPPWLPASSLHHTPATVPKLSVATPPPPTSLTTILQPTAWWRNAVSHGCCPWRPLGLLYLRRWWSTQQPRALNQVYQDIVSWVPWVIDYGSKNMDTTQFPHKRLDNYIPRARYDPTTSDWREWTINLKRTWPGVIHTSSFPHLGSQGRAGSHHLSPQPVLSSSPGSAHTRPPHSHTRGFSNTE